MLQQMRASAKWVWLFVAAAFIGVFLFAESSGLLGKSPVTPTSAVATVNGTDILYRDYLQRAQNEIQSQQQRTGRTLTEDESERVRNAVFDDMVNEVLLEQEYQRRGIFVTDEEIREYARFAPPQWITQAPELQTDGRFDPAKYQRFLASPAARQQGVLAALEQQYRQEIPRDKLMDQIAAGVYVTDADLWRLWRDQNDSAQVSYVSYHPQGIDSTVLKSVSEGEMKDYFEKHKDLFNRPGRAVLSVLEIRRQVTAADSAAARHTADSLRSEIVSGRAKFEDVAKAVSADTASGAQGGSLGKYVRGGGFIKPFEDAAYSLKPGEISQPVLTDFGYHIIRVDERKGDTLSLHHILVRISASDSAAARLDRKADSLARIASNGTGTKLDSAAKALKLTEEHVVALEGEPAQFNGHLIPSVSAWSFTGAKPGDISDLFDDENGYYVARLDTLVEGGEPKFENVKEDVRKAVAYGKQLDKLEGEAKQLSTAARSSTLEAAAAAAKQTVEQTPMFTRSSFVPGLGQFTEPVGAAFGLPIGKVSAPVRSEEAVFVMRVDKRTQADSARFESQKDALRQQQIAGQRQQRVQLFLQDLRKSAKVVDHRKDLNAAARRQES